MKRHTRPPQTPNHERVFGLLQKAARPMTAYELLDRLRPSGITAPPTVYRALDRLTEEGRAHRLESLNAFVACAHPHHGASAMFSICGSCGTVAEFSDPGLDRRIAAWARDRSFEVERAVLEVRGRCDACNAAHPKAVSTGA